MKRLLEKYSGPKPTPEQTTEFNQIFCIHKTAFDAAKESNPEIEDIVVNFLDAYKKSESKEKEYQQIRELMASCWSRKTGNGIISQYYKRCDKRYIKCDGYRSLRNIAKDLESRIENAGFKELDYISANNTADICDFEPGSLHYYVDTDYGSCEGIYIDVIASYIKMGERTRDYIHIMTVKTLGNSMSSFIYMSKIATYINICLKNDGFELKLSSQDKKELALIMEK